MKMKSSPSQFELAELAMMVVGTHTPKDRVKLAMAVWEEAGVILFPESEPHVAVSLDQLLRKLLPDVGNGKIKKTAKELDKARMAKFRKFLESREWARWEPDYVRYIPNERDGGQMEIPVLESFVQKSVRAELINLEEDGIFEVEKVEEEFRLFCANEKVRREVKFSERGRKGAAASQAKKVAAKASSLAATAPKKAVSPKKNAK